MWRIQRPWKKFLRGKLKPEAPESPPETIARIAVSVSGGIRSSASRTRTQGAAPVDGHLFLGAEALPGLDEDVTAEVAGDLEGPVGAPRVDDDNLICEGNALQAVGKVCGLVFCDDRNGKRYFFSHGHLSDRPAHAGCGHHTTEGSRIKTMK
jgi:hypothetical protein